MTRPSSAREADLTGNARVGLLHRESSKFALAMLPELQRLLARGAGTLPELVVVDLWAVGRWIWEYAPPAQASAIAGAPALVALIAAVRATHRRFLFIAGPEMLPSNAFDQSKLDYLAAEVARELGSINVIQSSQPLNGLIGYAEIGHVTLTVLSADVRANPIRLFPLDRLQVKGVVDIADGQLWNLSSVATLAAAGDGTMSVEPVALARIEALIKLRAGQRYPFGTKRAAEHSEALFAHLGSMASIDAPSGLPKSIVSSAVKHQAQWLEWALELEGHATKDPVAITAFNLWLAEVQAAGALLKMEAYLVPEVLRSNGGELSLTKLHAVVDGIPCELIGAAAIDHLRKLVELIPERWVAPRALDLLGFMVDEGLALPRKILDPAITAFALEPDAPSLAIRRVRGDDDLSPPALAALWDRDGRSQLRDGEQVLLLLPRVEFELLELANANGMLELVNNDIAATLPVLATIERRGAGITVPAGFLSWPDFVQHVDAVTAGYEAQFKTPFGREDAYRHSLVSLVATLKRWVGHLPATHWAKTLHADDELRRLARQSPIADAAARARQLRGKVQPWISLLPHQSHLRGRHVPTRTGRWTFRDPALHSLLKRSAEAKELRTALTVPPFLAGESYELVAMDYSAFELRLLAGLSGDPALLAAVQIPGGSPRPDPFAWIRDELKAQGIVASRDSVKQVMHAMGYGSGRKRIVAARDELSIKDAGQLFDALEAMFPGRRAFRKQVIKTFHRRGFTSTPSGARRSPQRTKGPRAAERAAFNFIVQGRAADIFRFVLRQLHVALLPHEAFIVHQLHDEVYVAAPAALRQPVVKTIRSVMTTDVSTHTNFLPPGIDLVVGAPRFGKTWGELV